MKKHTLLALLFPISLYAQNAPLQPFESLGKTVKVLTLSNGKYNENFPNDSIMRIGSVLYNRNTGELVSVIPPDTLGQPRTDVPSRWLSIDPLAHKFAAWSPYNFVMNNPVYFIDPDGRETTDHFFDKQGNYIGSTSVGNAIKVVDAGVTFEQAATTAKSTLIADFDYSQPENKQMLGNIMTHFAPQAGVFDDIKVGETKREGGFLYTKGGGIYMNTFKGRIDAQANDANNIINSIGHEKLHVENPKTSETLAHARVSIAQMGYDSFENTTDEFKSGVPGYIQFLLNDALDKGESISTKSLESIIDATNKYSKQTGTELFLDDKGRVERMNSLPDVKITAPKPEK